MATVTTKIPNKTVSSCSINYSYPSIDVFSPFHKIPKLPKRIVGVSSRWRTAADRRICWKVMMVIDILWRSTKRFIYTFTEFYHLIVICFLTVFFLLAMVMVVLIAELLLLLLLLALLLGLESSVFPRYRSPLSHSLFRSDIFRH